MKSPFPVPSVLTGLALFSCLVLLCEVVLASSFVAVSPLDGVFQSYDAVRRVASGQMPGRDFPSFHGVGISLLHFPVFALLGGTFHASIMSDHLLPVIFAVATFSIFFRLLGWQGKSLAWAVILVALASVVPLLGALFMEVGGSLFGIRTWFVLFTGLLAVAALRSGARVPARLALAGFLAGLSLFCFNDQGTAQFLALTATLLLEFLLPSDNPVSRGQRLSRFLGGLARAMVFVALALCAYVGLLWLVCSSRTVAVLTFNWQIVPGDQFWYFGCYPNPWIRSFEDLLVILADNVCFLPFVVISGLFVSLMRNHSPTMRLAGLFLICYGFASMTPLLGYVVRTYLHGQGKVAFLLAIPCALVFLARPAGQRCLARLRAYLSLPRAAFVFLAVVSLGLVWKSSKLSPFSKDWVRYDRDDAVRILPPFYIDADYAGLLAEFEEKMSQREAVPGETVLWSEYSGLLEARMKTFNPYTDYMIAALGDAARAQYNLRFEETKPVFVQTLALGCPPYGAWLFGNHWGFYRELFSHYQVCAQHYPMTLWRRNAQPFPLLSQPSDRVQIVPNVEFSSPPVLQESAQAMGASQIHLFVSTVTYRAVSPNHFLSGAREKLTRVILTKEHALNIEPLGAPSAMRAPVTIKIPTITRGDDPAQIGLLADGILGRASIEILKTETVEIIGLPPDTLQYLATIKACWPDWPRW